MNHRLEALLPLWSWLPAFRAVAETEHLPSAARLLGTGPSSLSRAISLLERAVKKPLFQRTGRSLRLNDDGQALLIALRDAMRLLDDGLQDLAAAGRRGHLVIASSGAATTVLVAPALARLRAVHPRLLPQLVTRAASQVASELLRGKIDVAFQELPVHRDGLVTRRLGPLTRGIYCGARHSLFRKKRVRLADLELAEFVAAPADAEGLDVDGWPADRPRRVALTTDQLRVGLELCIAEPLLAVLPDVLAASRPDVLWRVPFHFVLPSELFAIHRRVLGSKVSAAVELVDLVQFPA